MNIAIVNDSVVVAEALRRIVTATPDHRIVWIAHGGDDAVRKCVETRPDLVLMDLIMPHMDGIETTRMIMQCAPCAILIVTATPNDNVDQVFRALGAGALDVTAVPKFEEGDAHADRLLAKIKMIGKLIQANRKAPPRSEQKKAIYSAVAPDAGIRTLVAIGASTGGPMALSSLLSGLTIPAAACVVVVQHIDQRFADTFATWLASQVQLPVQVIDEGSSLIPGHVLIAKTNDHLLLDEGGRLRYSPVPLDYPYRPSIDVFFHHVAELWRHRAIGVLLTGMGRDGADGLLAMRRAGMLTIAQDQATSAVYGMPRAAFELDAAEMILPLPEIASALRERMHAGKAFHG
jgi:two-component system, chemotaxis family, response regulator WspF